MSGLPRRPLGRSGLTLSCLGLGTVGLGRNRDLRLPPFAIPDDAALDALLAAAEELGINLLDTAPAYGASEQRLGRWLQGRRSRWVLSTKVGEDWQPGRSRYDFSPLSVRRSVARSLARLRTDYLDLVFIHAGADDRACLSDGALDTLLELKGRGLIRAVGHSHRTAAGAEDALRRGAEVLMTDPLAEPEALPTVLGHAARRGCGVLLKKALSSGRLGPEVLPERLALPAVSSVLVGTTRPEHLRACAGALRA